MSRWQVSLKKATDAQGQIERILSKLLVITLCDVPYFELCFLF